MAFSGTYAISSLKTPEGADRYESVFTPPAKRFAPAMIEAGGFLFVNTELTKSNFGV
jgi:hypothetical protein